MKRCSACHETKPLEEFYSDRSHRDGHGSRCKACVNAANAAAYAKDPAKKRASNDRWAKRNPGRMRAASRRHYERNRELYRSRGRAYYEANREVVIARTKAWQAAHPDRKREFFRKWRIDRRAAGMERPRVRSLPADGLVAKFEYWGNRCWMCGSTEALGADHVKPVARGGLHLLANIRPACLSCNSRKRDRWPWPVGRAA